MCIIGDIAVLHELSFIACVDKRIKKMTEQIHLYELENLCSNMSERKVTEKNEGGSNDE